MAVSVSEFNGIKAYNFSLGNSLPSGIESISKKKNAAQDAELKKKVELIYDFQFNTSAQNLEITKDGKYVVATGIYPPRLKIFDVNDMALKVERGIDSEIVKMKMLSDDYKKVAMACVDRNIEVHAQYGRHYKVRIPKMPRDMDYNPFTCDLFVSGSDEEIFRLNLEEGKFLSSFKCSSPGVNKILFHPGLELLFAGGASGILSVFDYQQRSL